VVPAPGHTAGMQAVVVRELGHVPIFFVTEVATLAIQFARLPWVTAYDVLPLVSIDTKRHWQQRALDEGAIVIGSHDPHMPVWTTHRSLGGQIEVRAAADPRIHVVENP
jgi:glyoxylase-like metal-dependent hydrolase (beta-lactamase superfamily II)